MSITELNAGETLKTKHTFKKSLPVFPIAVMFIMRRKPPRLQFLRLPLHVNSLERVSGWFLEKFARM